MLEESPSAFEITTEKFIREKPQITEELDLVPEKYFANPDDHEGVLDVYELFRFYNPFFFYGKLDACFVRWSKRMTLCAGTCQYNSPGTCTITLSESLLQFRTNDEIKETLLHEMIHAYLFVTNPKAAAAGDGHGPEFLALMHHINSVTGLHLSVYHNFIDEVNHFRKHVWKCDGPCKDKAPFFGYVRRAMNRPPGPKDFWHERHQKECGGTWTKVDGPEFSEEAKKKEAEKEQKRRKRKQPENFGKTLEEYLKKSNSENEDEESDLEKGKKSRMNENSKGAENSKGIESSKGAKKDSKDVKWSVSTLDRFFVKKDKSNENSQMSVGTAATPNKTTFNSSDFAVKAKTQREETPNKSTAAKSPIIAEETPKKEIQAAPIQMSGMLNESSAKSLVEPAEATLLSLKITYTAADNDYWRLILINEKFSLNQFVNVLSCALFQRSERDNDVVMFYQNEMLLSKRLQLSELLDQKEKREATVVFNHHSFKVLLEKKLPLTNKVSNPKFITAKDRPVCIAGFTGLAVLSEFDEEASYDQGSIDKLFMSCVL